jgi:hypothetical protein
MKEVMISFMVILMSVNSFCQQSNSVGLQTREDYLKRSKNQKTTAYILLAGGVVALGAGLMLATREEASFGTAATGVFLGGIGLASAIVSIPIFNASARNKRKAMNTSAYLEVRQFPLTTPSGSAFHSYPALSMILNFKH